MGEFEFEFVPNDPYYSDWDGHEDMVWESREPEEEEEDSDD